MPRISELLKQNHCGSNHLHRRSVYRGSVRRFQISISKKRKVPCHAVLDFMWSSCL